VFIKAGFKSVKETCFYIEAREATFLRAKN